MSTTDGKQGGDVVVVCPSCDGSLTIATEEIVQARPGETIALFCAACERDVKVRAPRGLGAIGSCDADAMPTKPVTEFPVTLRPDA